MPDVSQYFAIGPPAAAVAVCLKLRRCDWSQFPSQCKNSCTFITPQDSNVEEAIGLGGGPKYKHACYLYLVLTTMYFLCILQVYTYTFANLSTTPHFLGL